MAASSSPSLDGLRLQTALASRRPSTECQSSAGRAASTLNQPAFVDKEEAIVVVRFDEAARMMQCQMF